MDDLPADIQAAVAKIKAALGPVPTPTTGDVAALLPPHMHAAYWKHSVGRYFQQRERGYDEGPTLQPQEPPWPLRWEQDPRIDDGHGHCWEKCHLIGDNQYRAFSEDVVRCRACHAPRCGPSQDDDPCMERLHHRDMHIHLSGRFRPLGDLLPVDPQAG